MSVGTKIRRLRLQNKWSQEELAHKLNVAQTSVSNFEANKTIPDFLVMQKVCEVFEVGFEYFVEDTGNTFIIEKVENSNNNNIGYKIDVVNTMPEGILENMLKRIEAIEKIVVSK
ncbi:helix-turn-helix transcriptional regulator [Flavobacterium jejuense]|uniref:Helix-turn-helix transcriptional regulator n=1 Tax=Flavobacterium jejuense TaxID=1544455 RepID=A0ABX0IX75_9FLAO|nr:helix-turn-helix transcriptional regulator [Flavobacterium jejuense]NHN27372.1 helix-turn-helix transcriptional regulator [Flavobacterium jejuense]